MGCSFDIHHKDVSNKGVDVLSRKLEQIEVVTLTIPQW